MRSWIRWIGSLACLVGAPLGAGCVAWGSTTARPPEAAFQGVAPPPHARLPLGLALDYQGPEGRDLAGTRRVRLAAEAAFAESPVFRLADRDGAAHVLALQLVSEPADRVWLTVLCILTGTLLPAIVSEHVDITARLQGPGGRVLAERRLSLDQTTMVELFGLFGMPFAWEGSVRAALWRDVLRDLLAWSEEVLSRTVEEPPAPPAEAS